MHLIIIIVYIIHICLALLKIMVVLFGTLGCIGAQLEVQTSLFGISTELKESLLLGLLV